MEDKELTKNEENELKREVEKLGCNYAILSKTSKKHLRAAYIFYKDELENFNNEFSKATKHNYSISAYCKHYNLARSALYNQKDGKNRQECVIQYIIEKQTQFDSKKKGRITAFLRNNDFDRKLLNQLLEKEIEYANTANELAEAKATIRQLENTIKMLRNRNQIE